MSTQLKSFNHPIAAVASGSALTLEHDDEIILWLFGDVDLALSEELDAVSGHALRLGHALTVEASRIAFCDLTFVDFLAPLASVLTVRVRRPSLSIVQLLALTGVLSRLKVED